MFFTLLSAAAYFKGNWESEVIFFWPENVLSKNSITGSFRTNKSFTLQKIYPHIREYELTFNVALARKWAAVNNARGFFLHTMQ